MLVELGELMPEITSGNLEKGLKILNKYLQIERIASIIREKSVFVPNSTLKARKKASKRRAILETVKPKRRRHNFSSIFIDE